MRLTGILMRIEKNAAWGVLGALMGVIGIYQAMEKTPEVTFDVVNEASVLNFENEFKNLELRLNDKNIRDSGLRARVLTVRIENTGSTDILEEHFDRDEPWGLQVLGGEIVGFEVAKSNSAYLKRNIRPTKASRDSLSFSKVILDRGDFLILNVLVLHPRPGPKVRAFGKIAGIDAFVLKRSWLREPGGMWRKAFAGSVSVQAIRMAVYAVAALLAVFLLSLTILLLSAMVNAANRKMRRLRQPHLPEHPTYHKIFLKLYVAGGRELVLRLNDYLSDENLDAVRHQVLDAMDDSRGEHDRGDYSLEPAHNDGPEWPKEWHASPALIQAMIDSKALKIEDKLEVDEQFRAYLGHATNILTA